MRYLLVILVSLGVVNACAFDTSAIGKGSDDAGKALDAAETVDARIPADARQNCDPGSKICVGDTIQTCKADGSEDDPALAVDCDFTYVDNSGAMCVKASNIDDAAALCEGNYKSLVAGDLAEVVFTAPDTGFEVIACAGLCGGLLQTIVPVASGGDYAIFCLSELRVAQTATVKFNDYPGRKVVLIVEGAVDVQGDFDFSGTGSSQGPGGGRGGGLNGGIVPLNGVGACAGKGGETDDDDNGNTSNDGNYVGGGGGGAGNEGRGGHGQRGRGYDDNNVGRGDRGPGGGSCSQSDLIPLVGGSGGGSGGDGKCGGACGWSGGGGGGAIQISSKTSITIGGSFAASGANGGNGGISTSHGGGGGGGSGGGILLEAPIINTTGRLEVEGGAGGAGSGPNRLGGAGAKDGENEGLEGQDLANDDRAGGVGGGGGGGRVRLNSILALSCSDFDISPEDACSTGDMLTP